MADGMKYKDLQLGYPCIHTASDDCALYRRHSFRRQLVNHIHLQFEKKKIEIKQGKYLHS